MTTGSLRKVLPRRPDRWVRPAVITSLAVVAAGSAAQLIDHGLHLGIGVLDSSTDGGIFGVVGDVSALAAAAAAWLALARVRHRRRVLAVLAPLLTFIAVDKVTRLHDHVPGYLLLYAPVLLAAFACLLELVRRVPAARGPLIVAGLALLAVSFGLHVLAEPLLRGLGLEHADWARQVKAVVKHGSEVEGWLLVTFGLIRVARPAAEDAGRTGCAP